jgi:hypothetical protein
MDGYSPKMRFHGAALSGRKLVIRYCSVDPLFALDESEFETDEFFWGFYFGNSEVGDSSVKAAPLLLRNFDNTVALGDFSNGGRLSHTGKDFQRRFEGLLATVVERTPNPEKLKSRLERLRQISLGFERGKGDDVYEVNFDRWVRFLQRKEFRLNLARHLIRNAILQGSYDVIPIPDISLSDRKSWSKRTVYDLYNSLSRSARSISLGMQERLEQAAYGLINTDPQHFSS